MKFKHFISSLFVCFLLVISIVFFWTSCNKPGAETEDALKSNYIVLSLSEAETVEENGAIYMERIASASLADTEYPPTHGFKFSIKWADETDKVLSEYLEITKMNLLTATLRIKQKFDEKVLFEIVSDPEGYYGAFLLTYEGAPTAIENLPSETSMKAGVAQEFDLSSFNPLNPDASEEFNDFSVEVKYYGSIKFKEGIVLEIPGPGEKDHPYGDEYGYSKFEGSEKVYSDLTKIPGISDSGCLVDARIEDGILILSQESAFSSWKSMFKAYKKDEHKFGPCIIYEDFVECLTAPYAEVTVIENTSGYVQKIKVWMDV